MHTVSKSYVVEITQKFYTTDPECFYARVRRFYIYMESDGVWILHEYISYPNKPETWVNSIIHVNDQNPFKER